MSQVSAANIISKTDPTKSVLVDDIISKLGARLSPAANAPTTRDNGTSLQSGDSYYNLTDNYLYFRKGINWVSDDKLLTDGKAAKGNNNDITQLSALSVPLNVAQGGGNTDYISGLYPSRDPLVATTLKVSPGSAYIPSLGRNVVLASTVTLSGLSLTANTWYYLYLYESSPGVAAIELVTTVPTTTYMGMPRTKTGDNTRRMIAQLRSNTTGGLWNFLYEPTIQAIEYIEDAPSPPFRTFAGALTTTNTQIDLSTVVPPTTRTAYAIMSSGGSGISPTAGLFLLDSINANKQIRYCSVNERIWIKFVCSALQQTWFKGATNNESGVLDITGYGLER